MADEKKAKVRRPTAQKRDIQHAKRRLKNRSFKTSVKTAMRALEEHIEAKKSDEAKNQLNTVYSLLDKGVKRGVYTINKASRLKSKFSGQI